VDGHGSGHYIDQGRERQNYEAPPSALAAGEQGGAVGGFDGQSAHDLDHRAKRQSNHDYEADDRHP